MRTQLLIPLLALTGACAGTQAPTEAPHAPTAAFDYEGVPLGISLAEFRRIRLRGEPPFRAICVGDDFFGPDVMDCVLRNSSGEAAPLHFDHTVWRSTDNIFFFAADRVNGTMRLFRIVLTGEGHGATREAILAGFRHDIVMGLAARFGAPAEDHSVTNTVGFEPGNIDSTARWQNAVSKIEVAGPNQSEFELSREIRVFYELNDLVERAFELRNQWMATRQGQSTP